MAASSSSPRKSVSKSAKSTTPATRTPAKKTAAKQAPAKSAAAKKTVAKKAPAKRPVATATGAAARKTPAAKKAGKTTANKTTSAPKKHTPIKVGYEPDAARLAAAAQAQAEFERSGAGRLPHRHREERVAEGHLARARVSLAQLGDYAPVPGRPSPIDVVLGQESTRLANLLPVRHMRMAQSPFTFYRGSAILMAQDLGSHPTPLLPAQIGGDAHMSNFGFYAADDRRLVFDMNDFDETRPGPFEWDVKRYAASILLAARDNDIPDELAERAILIFARRYAWWIREFAVKPSLEVWYDRLDVQTWVDQLKNAPLKDIENLIASLEGGEDRGAADHILVNAAKAAVQKAPAKATANSKKKSGKKDKGNKFLREMDDTTAAEDLRQFYVTAGTTVLKRAAKKTGQKAVNSLTEVDASGRRQFINNPPLIERLVDDTTHVSGPVDGSRIVETLRSIFRQYRASLPEDRRVLVDRYSYRDAALKVVGVGSVGTRAAVMLLEGQGDPDPFILQIKEAGESVLTPYIPAEFKAAHLPTPTQMGKRVVLGQRLMQATSDIFLGYVSSVVGPAGFVADYYIRQLKDMKYSFDVESMDVATLMINALLVARVLGHAHGRTGDPLVLAAYIGDDDQFAEAILAFSKNYVQQVQADFDVFTEAIRSGDIEVSATVDG